MQDIGFGSWDVGAGLVPARLGCRMYDLGCRGRPMCRPVNSNSRKHQMAKFKAV